MASKSVLKQIREHINANDNDGAFKLVQTQLKAGIEDNDYMLLLFAGKTSKNLGRLDEAVKFYKKAIDLAPDQMPAWLGVFEVINDQEWKEATDDFSFTVANKLIENTTNADKLIFYKKSRLRFLLALEKFGDLLQNYDAEPFLFDHKSCLNALKALNSKLGKANAEELVQSNPDLVRPQIQTSNAHRKLIRKTKSYGHLKFEFGVALNRGLTARKLLHHVDRSAIDDAESHLLICGIHVKLSCYDNYSKWIIDHIRRFPETSSVLIDHQAFCVLAHELLRSTSSLAPNLCVLASLCSRLKCPISSSDDFEFNQKIAKCFSAGNVNAAYDLIVSSEPNRMRTWPGLGLVLYTFRELGQCCRISNMLRSLSLKSLPSLDEMLVIQLKIEADFNIAEEPDEYCEIISELNTRSEDCKMLLEWKMKEIYVKSLIFSRQVKSAEEFERKLKELFVDDVENQHSLLHLRSFFNLYVSGQLDLARDLVRKAIAVGEDDPEQVQNDCRDILLSARILMAKGQRQLANTQLVCAAQKNAYDAEVFQLLAENLLATNNDLEKAKACAERARLFNPSSEKTMKILFQLYSKQDTDRNAVLNSLLSFLTEKPNSEWALKKAALLEINLGKLDNAVERIQKLVRVKNIVGGSNGNDAQSGATMKQEICSLWIFLGEAYKQKGNLQSAVRACKTALEISPMHYTAILQLIQLHQGMGHYESAMELGTSLLSSALIADHLVQHVQLIHAHSLLLYVSDENRSVEQQLEYIPELFVLLVKLLESSIDCTLLHKMVAQTMSVVLSFNESTLRQLISNLNLSKFGPFSINSRADALKCKIRCLTRILSTRSTVSDIWNELAMSFLLLHRYQPDEKLLEKCIECARKAILSTSSKLKRSEYWCCLGKVYLEGKNYEKAQHCFIRSIQLNRHGENAWCLLSLLYLKMKLHEQAFEAMNQAQKINPQLMEAWCAHAMHAEWAGDHDDAKDLFRHTIVLKPTSLSTKKYTYLLMEAIRNKSAADEGTMINFEAIKDLFYTAELTDEVLHSLSLLAEHFWYLEEAKKYISAIENASIKGLEINRNRIFVKSGDATEDCAPLNSFRALYSGSVSDIKDRLMKLPHMARLFNSISSNNVEAFSSAYKSNYYPLLVSASLIFDLSLSQELFSVVENVRPLHKLVDVYPIGMARANADMLMHQQLSEEERVLVRHDHLSDHLHDLLKQNFIESGLESTTENHIDLASPTD